MACVVWKIQKNHTGRYAPRWEKKKTTIGLPHKNVISYELSIPHVWCKSQEALL